jgi:hypothetical protein
MSEGRPNSAFRLINNLRYTPVVIVDKDGKNIDFNEDGKLYVVVDSTKIKDSLGEDITVDEEGKLNVTHPTTINIKDSSGNDIVLDANGHIGVVLYDSLNKKVEDSTTSALKVIDYEHHEIHSGSHFFIADYAGPLGINDEIDFIVTTSNTTKWAHMSFGFSSTGGFRLECYMGPTSVAGGTLVTPLNSNQNSATASTLTILKDPASIGALGTRLFGYLAGANKVSGFSDRQKEIILKQDTTYLFRFTSMANTNYIDFESYWYEHTNKA